MIPLMDVYDWKAMGEPFSEKIYNERFETFKRTKVEQDANRRKIHLEKESAFLLTLAQVSLDQFGVGYTRKHRGNQAACGDSVQGHIQTLLQTAMGACYSGCKGSGKTNILLEYFLKLSHATWIQATLSQDYPDPRAFIEKTVRFSYVQHLCKTFKEGGRVRLARYNLLDDLGVECPSDYVMADLDSFFEDINRHDKGLVITTNATKEDLERQESYTRILSRMRERCRFYELPEIDYRDPKYWDKEDGWTKQIKPTS
jgi:DNA replication protein DnaC